MTVRSLIAVGSWGLALLPILAGCAGTQAVQLADSLAAGAADASTLVERLSEEHRLLVEQHERARDDLRGYHEREAQRRSRLAFQDGQRALDAALLELRRQVIESILDLPRLRVETRTAWEAELATQFTQVHSRYAQLRDALEAAEQAVAEGSAGSHDQDALDAAKRARIEFTSFVAVFERLDHELDTEMEAELDRVLAESVEAFREAWAEQEEELKTLYADFAVQLIVDPALMRSPDGELDLGPAPRHPEGAYQALALHTEGVRESAESLSSYLKASALSGRNTLLKAFAGGLLKGFLGKAVGLPVAADGPSDSSPLDELLDSFKEGLAEQADSARSLLGDLLSDTVSEIAEDSFGGVEETIREEVDAALRPQS